MGSSVSQATAVGDASIPAASARDAFIAAFSRQRLVGGVMIGAQVGRMTSRFGESRASKYGRLMACPGKRMRLRESGRCDDQILLPRGEWLRR
jgi:hypothetical protein